MDKEKDNQLNEEQIPPLTEEELFIEEVLKAQEEALQQEREARLNGTKRKKRKPLHIRIIVWLMALSLAFSSFAVIFQIYSIPAIEFLKTSSKLSKDESIKTYKKSVVEISTGESKGTGFIMSSNGIIVTNAHVVDDHNTVNVIIPDYPITKGQVLHVYEEVDLAIVSVEMTDLPFLQLADSNDVSENEHIYFIGNPLFFTNIANEGTVVGSAQFNLASESGMLTAPVYKGNSGSPVINEQGEVIGVIYATAKTETYKKVGLYIPIEQLHNRYKME